MNAFVTVASLVVALSIMVLVHEWGHYVAAKRAKVVVEEFGVGYPPRLLTLWRSEGRVVLGGIPYVIPRKLSVPTEMQAGSFVFFEASVDDKGRKVLEGIELADEDRPTPESPHRVELLDRGTVYSVNLIPFGGFTKMLGEEDPKHPGSLARKGKLTRVVVMAAGSAMNLLTAVLFFSLALALGAPAIADPENALVTSVAPGSPAELSGLQTGDVIVRADGNEIPTVQSLIDYTQGHLGTEIVLTVERGDEQLDIPLVPRTDPPPGEAPIGIGLSARTTLKKYPWYEALWLGVKETVSLAGFILSVPIQVIRGLIPADLARPVGPVGVGQLVGGAVQYSISSGWWFPVMQMMGTLSVALAVTNLLPLPALDGGRILFIGVEAIRGKRVDPAMEGLVHVIGMLLLVALMVFITWQDVVNPVPTLDWSSLF